MDYVDQDNVESVSPCSSTSSSITGAEGCEYVTVSVMCVFRDHSVTAEPRCASSVRATTLLRTVLPHLTVTYLLGPHSNARLFHPRCRCLNPCISLAGLSRRSSWLTGENPNLKWFGFCWSDLWLQATRCRSTKGFAIISCQVPNKRDISGFSGACHVAKPFRSDGFEPLPRPEAWSELWWSVPYKKWSSDPQAYDCQCPSFNTKSNLVSNF